MTEGIDDERVTAWFRQNAPAAEPPLSFELITGGHSNLTYRVTDTRGARWVLRRPPLGQVLATAHDMSREHRIISALADTPVPVPGTIGLCTDAGVNGAPFYVMDFVDGLILRETSQAERLPPEGRERSGRSLIEVLTAIHAVDVDSVGLGDLGRREDYISRQLRRWNGQFQATLAHLGDERLPDLTAVHDALAGSIPPQERSTLVHGDYRLDNCLLTPSGPDAGAVAAVLDWEICTLGDPLADLGLLMVYWADPGDPAALPQSNYHTLPGFPRRAELLAHYAALTGADLGNIDFYVAFGYWKLGCIIAGVYSRYADGSMGDAGAREADGFRTLLAAIARTAADTAEGVP